MDPSRFYIDAAVVVLIALVVVAMAVVERRERIGSAKSGWRRGSRPHPAQPDFGRSMTPSTEHGSPDD